MAGTNSKSMAAIALFCMLSLAACGTTVSEGQHGLQSDGSFNLTAAESNLDCDATTQEIRSLADQTVALDLQTRQEVASSVAMGLLFGVAGVTTYRLANDAGEAGKKADRNRARMKALNASLTRKGCPTWDYEAQIDRKKTEISAKSAAARRSPSADGSGGMVDK